MAKGFSKVVVMGNLTRDPETRQTQTGQSVTSISLAVNRSWRNSNGEQQEEVSYIDCVAWGKAGEIIAQYNQKGSALLVSGRMQQSRWDQDGQTRSKIEIVVEDFNFISDGGAGSAQGGGSFEPSAPSSKPEPAKEEQKPEPKKETKKQDIDDTPIDLSDIPF